MHNVVTLMERDDYLTHLAHDGSRMAELARGDLDAPVPTCPEWTLKDLLEHTGQVHRWQTEACHVDVGAFPDPESFARAPRRGSVAGGLVPSGGRSGRRDDGRRWRPASLAGPGPSPTVATPPTGTSAASPRRRWCTASTPSSPPAVRCPTSTPPSPPTASPRCSRCSYRWPPVKPSEAMGGPCTSTPPTPTASGSSRSTPTRVDATRGHAKGDAALRGAARDLLMMVWGRDPLGAIEHLGDDSVIATFRAATKI